MDIDQRDHYQAKLAYEMDSADLHEAIEENKRIVVVDGRSAAAYATEHIPGAIRLPHREITSESTKTLD
jgi:rhodanese-related sulfurtransferase